MNSHVLVKVFSEVYTVSELIAMRREIAQNIAARSREDVAITGVRREGRETQGVVLSTYEEKSHFLGVVEAAITMKKGGGAPASRGHYTDFSQAPVEP